MSTRGSYDPCQEGGGFATEVRRLEAQVAASWTQELRALRAIGLRDGMRVLDIGCGPGYVSAALARAFPASRVTGVDHDAGLLAMATAAVAKTPHVTFLQASAARMPVPEAHVDFAIARYVFQHLPEPVAVARELRRVLKPGGRLAIIDVDAALWGVAEPSFPEVAPIYAKTGRAQAERGGDRLIGRRLHRILREAGFEDVQLDAFVYHSDDVGLQAFEAQITPDRLAPLHARGLVSDAEMATARRAHEAFLGSPRAFVMMIGLIGSGTRT
jgi:ubiquinone/menaquinone biosynthesis C-methylase UbiE